ncbi:MAG: hypothetical protein ABL914_00075 [Novosphingobium sp.]|uniref:hypothetical protein n=1 Tax=Novosphingobium sp. TaxID=1874826 RepID=UPI0032B9A6B8
MTRLRRFTLSLGAAALLAPAVAFAQPAADAPAQIDEIGCAMQLMFFVTEGKKTLGDATVPADRRLENSGFVTKMAAALGFFEGRIAARAPANLQAAGSAAFNRMTAMGQDQLVNSTMGCIAYYEAEEARLLGQLLGK